VLGLLPLDTAKALASFMQVSSRAYAIPLEKNGKWYWSRVHQNLPDTRFIERLMQGEPTAVSMYEYRDGAYVHQQAFVAFDCDCAGKVEAAGKAALEIRNFLISRGFSVLVSYTGKKGFRVTIYLKDSLPAAVVAAYQDKVLTELGWTRMDIDTYTRDGVECETLIISGNGIVVKVPFSRHQDKANRPGYFELPVTETMVDYIHTRPPTEEDWKMAVDAFGTIVQNDAEAIVLEIGDEVWEGGLPPAPVAKAKPVKDGEKAVPADFKIPDPSPTTKEIYERIIDRPCLKKALDSCRHTYWPRAVLAAAINAMGYKIEDAAAFFVRYVCDAEDLKNVGELQRQLAYHFPRKSNCMCRVFQNSSSNYYCCPGPCGRKRPSDVEPPLKLNVPEVTKFKTPEEYDAFFAGLVRGEGNASVLGAARSGKTTGIGMAVIRAHEQAVVLVPRLSIVTDTWNSILKMAEHEGVKTYACYIPDIRESCLKLRKLIKANRDLHGIEEGDTCAIEDLPYVTKPSCSDCPYKDNYVSEPEPNVLYGAADETEEICGYQTAIKNSTYWNIIVLTNKKWNRIAAGADEWFFTPIFQMITARRLFVLDEVSSYFENPETEVPVWSKHKTDNTKDFDWLEAVKNEAGFIRNYLEERLNRMKWVDGGGISPRDRLALKITTIDEVYKQVRGEIEQNYKVVIDDPQRNVFRFERTITVEEMDRIKKAFKLMEKSAYLKALHDNVALLRIYELIELGTELEWIFTNDPSISYEARVTIKIAPKTVGYINSATAGAKIITLDIIPAIIPLERLFGGSWQHHNIGDRAGIYKQFVIFPDSIHIRASELLREKYKERLIKVSRLEAKVFGDDRISILMPTIETENVTKRHLQDLPKIDYRHHRGTKTVGVHCDRRVAISVCAPFSPRTSLHWLKFSPFAAYLSEVTHNQLWFHQQAKETMQGEARYVDPSGMARSSVFAFGQPKWVVERSYMNSIVPPKIANVPRNAEGPGEIMVQVAQQYIYETHGIIVEKNAELIALRGILDRKDNTIIHNRSKLTNDEIEKLRYMLKGSGLL